MSASMMGKHQIAVNTTTLTDGDSIAAYLTSASGALVTSTTIGGKVYADTKAPSDFLDGSAYVAGTDYLSAAGGVDESGNWQPLNIDAAGALLVSATVNFAGDYAEDSPHVSGDIGLFSLLVRQDTLAASTSADGDYGAFKSNAAGSLYVVDTAANTSLSTIITNTGNTATNTASILAEIAALSYAEDTAHVSGDMGTMPLAVRNDTPGSLVNANGDYAPLQVDATGNLRVTGTVATATQYAEDSAAVSADMGNFFLGVRRDTTGTQTSASGDYSEIQTWSNGELKVVDVANLTILQQQVAVSTTAAQVPAANLANRKSLMIQNTGSSKVWVGGATLTSTGAASGIEVPANSFLELEAGPAMLVFAKTNAGSGQLNILEMS